MQRRDLLAYLASSTSLVGLVGCASVPGNPYRLSKNPFTLGVASGSPTESGSVIWTRLAPEPLSGGGLPPTPISVKWEVATDSNFQRVVQSGTAVAQPQLGHSVHVEVNGLAPNAWYWYRFRAGDFTTVTARTRTAPPKGAPVASAKIAYCSCQHYAYGFYDAYRDLVQQSPDVVLFLGDYIYESAARAGLPRTHFGPEVKTLEGYRDRYAQYKTDPHLQAAHAVAPWMITWDDHEVGNDLANDSLEDDADPVSVLRRRAAAYQAWYEHMPVRKGSFVPGSPDFPVYQSLSWGDLAQISLTDVRQYRSHQACPPKGKRGGNVVAPEACPQLRSADRTYLGSRQEAWFLDGLRSSKAHWNLASVQTLFSPLNVAENRDATLVRTDGWDGYTTSRQRVVEALSGLSRRNTVLIGGDVHSTWVTDVKRDYQDPRSEVVATEICTTSISSQAPSWLKRSQAVADKLVRNNEHVRFAWVEQRGYHLAEITPASMDVQLRVVADATKPNTPVTTKAKFRVNNGKAGALIG